MSRSPSPAAPRPRTDENVFLFAPNLIGYTRVILGAAALTYMTTHPKFCTVAYCVSALLDAVDGQVARALGQTSKFGAILDMVTDRCMTSCLLCFLASAYPRAALLFQFLISLDFSSHYIHMYASISSGSRSHKTVTKEQSWILWSYYNNSRTLFIFCAANELFFVALYVLSNYHKPLLTSLHALPPSLLALPAPVLKMVLKTSWPHVVAVLTAPIMVGKQIINVVQFWKAAKALTEADQEERYAMQMAKKQ
ncbi:CDP-diacylglycerol--inositol 3-phosphatidyltransferase [Rhodotorula toruloides]|uniref:CDP-diacylglycerol--inositol 3-phosphatidyltransferase n=1 Tax=Rhodotorula toruloides TaxID=5286 RepID=A0A0K3CGT7_RHOTO|nr:CDP-diacylglycerol--inositol 3-phosphatidyltransferase [Rhodotorula toruloides]PRQ73554.1 CDP-alcohol phosphatidyltransferase-domain containing protein [Rhodotorula toruloides]